MLGMHGTRAANYAMDEADLIVAVGARFDDRITGKLSEFAPRAKFIHIDIDPAEISKNVPAHIPIVGDAKRILVAAGGRVPGARPRRRRGSPAGGSGSSTGARQHPLKYDDSADSEIKPQFLVESLYKATNNGECILSLRRRPAPDVGGAVLPLQPAAPLDQLRRARDDGLRPAGRDRRRYRAARHPDRCC